MKLKYEAGLFVIEPQTTAENEVLKMLATDETSQAGSSAKGVMLGAPSEALPWECAVADALGAHLDGMSCESVSRVLRELQRMNAASVSGAFDTPARASPSLPAQEESSDVKEPPQGRPEEDLLSIRTITSTEHSAQAEGAESATAPTEAGRFPEKRSVHECESHHVGAPSGAFHETEDERKSRLSAQRIADATSRLLPGK